MISYRRNDRTLGKNLRNVAIMLRVSAEEHKLFLRRASAHGLSLSGWARMHLLEAAREQKKAG
jgi:hypothetical protein